MNAGILFFSLKKIEIFSTNLKRTGNRYKILKIEISNKSFPELGGNFKVIQMFVLQ